MKFKSKLRNLTIADSNIIKGIGILLIAFHNYFHWLAPKAKENEFDFAASGIQNLTEGIIGQPLESINLLFSFWGHYGVQLFIFISGYGLMKSYQNKEICWSNFISKRIQKLWPTFFFALFLFYSLMRLYWGLDLWNLNLLKASLLRISFLSNFIPGKQFMITGPWWFYSMIVQLYIIFPLLLKLHKKFGPVSLILVSLLAYVVTFLFNPWFVDNDSSLYLFLIANIPVFSLGMIWASKKENNLNYFMILGTILIFILGNYYLYFWYFSHLMFAILALFIISHFLNKKVGNKNFLYKSLLFYGEISMYFYAIHGFLRRPFIDLAKISDNALMKILWAIVFVVFSTIIALILKWVVNNYSKLIQWLSKKVDQIESKFFSIFISSTKRLFQIGFMFTILLLLLRVYEYFLLKTHHELTEISLDSFINVSTNDFLSSLAIIGIFILPYFCLSLLSRKVASFITNFIFSLTIVSSIILIQYYDFTLLPLDRVVYIYSLESIFHILQSSDISWMVILPYIFGLSIFIYLIKISKRIVLKPLFIILFSIVTIYFAMMPYVFIPKENGFESEMEYTYTNNKLFYFINSLTQKTPNAQFQNEEISGAISKYKKIFPQRNYLNPNFPFLRIKDKSNPFGPLFHKTLDSIPPNIVIIFVESLCPAVSGPYAHTASFTPYLDSLTQQSLFWRNNLATTERTFGVLPSALASLPFGENGFLNLNTSMPKHESLIQILQRNNYINRFFYGGSMEFNNMDVFFEANKIDTIVNSFDAKDSIPVNENGFSWGYSDGAILNSTFSTIKDSTTPYLSLYLTLSTHSPFQLKNRAHYRSRVIERLKELGIPEEQHSLYIKNQNKLATFLYFDDVLRNFFNEYSKRKDFERTIFIITGDHRGIIFERISPIDAYHTPLIIYSPLLKNPKEYGGVTSHLDLTPTLLNYLEEDYSIETPEEVTWLGGPIDTSEQFNSKIQLAFMRNSREIKDYLEGNYYISGTKLFKLTDHLQTEEVYNDTLFNRIKQNCNSFKTLNFFNIEGIASQSQLSVQQLYVDSQDFDHNTSDFFIKDTSSQASFSGKHSYLIGEDMPYASICPSIEIESGVSRIYINISFKTLIKEFGGEKASLIINLQKDGEHVEWYGINFLDNINTLDQWNSVDIKETLFIDKEVSEGSELKIYIWNKGSSLIHYDDLEIDIKIKQK